MSEQSERSSRVASDIVNRLFAFSFTEGFGVRLWDGTTLGAQLETARVVLKVNSPSALRSAFLPPLDLNPGRAFVAGAFDLDGDVEAAIDTFYRAFERLPKWQIPMLARDILRLPKPLSPAHEPVDARLEGRPHTRERDAGAIEFHYDLSASFYRTFLGDDMVYSCAYFADEAMTLEGAQVAKIDHILSKLRLRPGERLLDIGCGWGALVVRAAERYGATVLGVTLSHEQHRVANRRIVELGLQERAKVELRDYRDLRGECQFDKVVSVGMFEHVGRAKLAKYFGVAFDVLRPGGLFLNHGIADQSPNREGVRPAGFIHRYIFPDGELVPISDGLHVAERVGFEVRDVENLREHYARTLRFWVERIERARDALVATVGEPTYRAWRLYMAGSAQGFHSGRMGLFQTLLAKPDPDGRVALPPTREHLYHSRTSPVA